MTIEDLAIMIAKGFDETAKKAEVDARFDKIEVRLGNLEQGQEEIKLRLDQVAYRFEVQELDRRLKLVEMKLGLKPNA